MNELKKLFLNQNHTRTEFFQQDIQQNTILTTGQLLTTTTSTTESTIKSTTTSESIKKPRPTLNPDKDRIRREYHAYQKQMFIETNPASKLYKQRHKPYNLKTFNEPVVLPVKDKGWKIVVFIDTNYMRIGQIWWRRMQQLHYDNILILALELNAYDILKNQVEKGELKKHQIGLASFVLESFMIDDEGKNITDMKNWTSRSGGRYKQNYEKRKFKSIWKIRINTVKALLREGYSVFQADVDSIWMKYYDLNKLPENIDAFYVWDRAFPGTALKAWNFTLCGGTTGFRPTAAVHAMFDEMSQHCALACDDQTEINSRLLHYDVEWVDPSETSVKSSFPLSFFKFGYTKKSVFLRTAIFKHEDVLRGWTLEPALDPKLCEKVWFMMPMATGQADWMKLDMINKFIECLGVDEPFCNPHYKGGSCYKKELQYFL